MDEKQKALTRAFPTEAVCDQMTDETQRAQNIAINAFFNRILYISLRSVFMLVFCYS